MWAQLAALEPLAEPGPMRREARRLWLLMATCVSDTVAAEQRSPSSDADSDGAGPAVAPEAAARRKRPQSASTVQGSDADSDGAGPAVAPEEAVVAAKRKRPQSTSTVQEAAKRVMQRLPGLLDSVALCFVALRRLGAAVLFPDLQRLMLAGRLPYADALAGVPAAVATKVPRQLLQLLRPLQTAQVPSQKAFDAATRRVCEQCCIDSLPPPPTGLLLRQYGAELCMPPWLIDEAVWLAAAQPLPFGTGVTAQYEGAGGIAQSSRRHRLLHPIGAAALVGGMLLLMLRMAWGLRGGLTSALDQGPQGRWIDAALARAHMRRAQQLPWQSAVGAIPPPKMGGAPPEAHVRAFESLFAHRERDVALKLQVECLQGLRMPQIRTRVLSVARGAVLHPPAEALPPSYAPEPATALEPADYVPIREDYFPAVARPDALDCVFWLISTLLYVGEDEVLAAVTVLEEAMSD